MRKLRQLFPVAGASPHSVATEPDPGATRDLDAGLTLVELLVAMMVFAILALGVAYSMLATLQSSRDSRGRAIASNLAAQEVDLVRSVDDIFTIGTITRQTTVAGTAFTVTRATDWVNSGVDSGDCGTGSGVLQHKKINVTVSWGTGASQRTVHTDTIVAPTSKINDPTLGTIVIHVKRADGTGAEGVTVTATPSSTPGTATAIATSIPNTDANGCTFALKVTPGNYDVSITKTDFVTEKHLATETRTMQKVAKGSATNVRFSYDRFAQFTPTYSFSNPAAAGAAIPAALDLSFVNTFGTFLTRRDLPSPKLHPFAAGYTVLAGKVSGASGTTATCDSIDPVKWPTTAADASGKTRAGWPVTPTAADPGSTAEAVVPLGAVAVTTPTNVTVTATSTVPETGSPAAADHPLCATTMTYTFPSATGTRNLALPFGTWKLTTSSGAVIGASTGTSVTPLTGGSVTAGIVTLDPRVEVTP